MCSRSSIKSFESSDLQFSRKSWYLMSKNRCSDVQNGYRMILESSCMIWFDSGSLGNLKIIPILAGLMIALTSLFHANPNKTNDIQSDHQQVCQKDIHSQNCFHNFKSLIHFRGPTEGFFTRFVKERLKQMGLLRPHEPVCIDSIKETLHFLEVALWFLLKVGRNMFFQWLETNWRQPVTKPIGFLDSPLTLERVYGEDICFKMVQDFL